MKKIWILVLAVLCVAAFATPCYAAETENSNTEVDWFPPETTATTTISFPTITTAETTTEIITTDTTTVQSDTDESSAEETTVIPMPIETTTVHTDTTAATSATTADTSFFDLLFTDYLVYFVISVCVLLIVMTVIICICLSKSKKRPKNKGLAHKKISIRVEFGPSFGKAYDFLDSFCIGRDKNRCEVVLPMDTEGADAVHARIFADTKGVHLIDLGSSCGTFLEDGTRLEASKEYLLISGSRFYIGSRKNFFTVWF